MKIVEVKQRNQNTIDELVILWEASVRATHTFLTESEVLRIKEYVPEALADIKDLFIYQDEKDKVLGFMGVQDGCLEMLFISPKARSMGIGRQLLEYGVANCGVNTLTVNEQNPQAVGFYEYMGFRVYKRSEMDEQGGPYPLLYMRLDEKTGCVICGAPLRYLDKDQEMECFICHKKQSSRAECINGHFVCDECHMHGVDKIMEICLAETSVSPVFILEKLMDESFCHMHGPEHHIMVGASLLTAYKNAGGDIELKDALLEMYRRGKDIPGGICGYWGACGAGISAGIFVSIVTGSNPLAEREWSLSNRMTSLALNTISENGGPRCCKRNSYIAVTEGVRFAEEQLGVKMQMDKPVCSRFEDNQQCRGHRCLYFPK